MTAQESLAPILEELPDDRQSQLLAYARYLRLEAERQTWQEFGRAQLARAYGDDEPEYTEADLRKAEQR
jgi:hypothetical protein